MRPREGVSRFLNVPSLNIHLKLDPSAGLLEASNRGSEHGAGIFSTPLPAPPPAPPMNEGNIFLYIPHHVLSRARRSTTRNLLEDFSLSSLIFNLSS